MNFGVHPDSRSPLAMKIAARAKAVARAAEAAECAAQKPVLVLPPKAVTLLPATAVLMTAVAALAAGGNGLTILGRQIALFLLAEKHGAEAAAAALQTIPESIRLARSTVAPIVASLCLTVEPTAECFAQIVAAFERPSRHTRKRLIKLCAEMFKVDVQDMLSARRTQNIVWPRQVAMFLCKKFTPSSYPEIGASFGGRDHTTVLHAVHKLEGIVASAGLDCGDDPRAWALALMTLREAGWKPQAREPVERCR